MLPKLSKFQREHLIALHKEMLRELEVHAKPRCGNCEHHRDQPGKTKCAKFNANPPEEVRDVGCEHWSYDEIPF